MSKQPALILYPDKVLTLDPKKYRGRNPPAPWRNEFFYIEALLRSESLSNAYRKEGKPGLIKKLRTLGIIRQDPLQGTHHALLSEPPPVNNPYDDASAQIGFIRHRGELYFLDLGLIAQSPPNQVASVNNLHHIYGVQNGLAACQAWLKDNDPMHLCLWIDLDRPTNKILHALRLLLKKRKKQAKALPRDPGPFGKRFELQKWKSKTPFNDIEGWLQYLQCYDLKVSGHTMRDVGRKVYGDQEGDSATTRAKKAVERVKKRIKQAERGIAHWP